VPGLYAAGDTATRELICGGFTGGGSHNAAWAASSGSWSGRGAAAFATRRNRPVGVLRGLGGAGLRPTDRIGVDYREVVAETQRHVLPHRDNFLRYADHLEPALQSLHGLWSAVREGLSGTGEDVFRAREAAAMVAHSRWMYQAALQRTETRGMHKRTDHPALDPAQQYRLLTGGLDEVWSRPETARLATMPSDGRAA
jgi:succinate dehydrogenase/fumarate reductase flavoprotein subunit